MICTIRFRVSSTQRSRTHSAVDITEGVGLDLVGHGGAEAYQELVGEADGDQFPVAARFAANEPPHNDTGDDRTRVDDICQGRGAKGAALEDQRQGVAEDEQREPTAAQDRGQEAQALRSDVDCPWRQRAARRDRAQ